LGTDTLVFASDGNLLNIADVKSGHAVKSALFGDYSVHDSTVLDAWSTKKDECYKITTKYPRLELESSKDHVFFVWENGALKERAAKELKEGDTLLMPEKISVGGKVHKLKNDQYFSFGISPEGRKAVNDARTKKGLLQKQLAKAAGITQTAISSIEIGKRDLKLQNLENVCRALGIDFERFCQKYVRPKGDAKLPGTLGEELAQILGYFTGDGNFDKNRIAFSESDKQLAEHYAAKVNEVFGVKPVIKFRKNKNYYQTKVCSKAVESFMREITGPRNALRARIPENVLCSPDSVLAAFLRGLFDAEGCISGGRFGLGVQSRVLASQVQMSLLRFGVISSLLEYDCRKNPYSKNHRFTVEISEKESLELLRDNVGFGSLAKQTKLALTIKSKSEKSEVRQVLLSGKAVRALIEKHGMIKQDFPKVCDYFYDRKQIGKKAFENSIIKYAESNKELHKNLKAVLNCRILPVKIRSIAVRKGSVPMADISVEGRNFIANGLVVHNSAQRFERVRAGLLGDWLKEVAEQTKELIPKDVLGIVVGGPGPIKGKWLDEGYLPTDVRKKVLAVQDTGYADEHGLEELVNRAKDVFAQASVAKERQLVQKFLENLMKGTGLAAYGIKSVTDALEKGAVDTILVSEDAPYVRLELEDVHDHGEKRFVRKDDEGKVQTCKACGERMSVMGRMDVIDAFKELAEQTGAAIEVISKDTREGEQLLALGGVAALLRYRLQ
jgi:intein/homing endonuclease